MKLYQPWSEDFGYVFCAVAFQISFYTALKHWFDLLFLACVILPNITEEDRKDETKARLIFATEFGIKIVEK